MRAQESKVANRMRLVGISALLALAVSGCGYIVMPDEEGGSPTNSGGSGWSASVMKVGPSESGGLRVELAIRNDTGDWSEMHAADGKPARLSGSGGSHDCATVKVGTGGHRFAPGFRMRGYTVGTKAAPVPQLLYVECAGVTSGAGEKLAIDYTFVTGAYNYYTASQESNRTMEVKLDDVAADLAFPVAKEGQTKVSKPGEKIPAINGCDLVLTKVERTPTGLKFSWESSNPTDYPANVHIGTPPVIGADGILYGLYESPHLGDSPDAQAKGKADWTTEVKVPAEVKGLYILVPVESLQQKNFVSHAIDITTN